MELIKILDDIIAFFRLQDTWKKKIIIEYLRTLKKIHKVRKCYNCSHAEKLKDAYEGYIDCHIFNSHVYLEHGDCNVDIRLNADIHCNGKSTFHCSEHKFKGAE